MRKFKLMCSHILPEWQEHSNLISVYKVVNNLIYVLSPFEIPRETE